MCPREGPDQFGGGFQFPRTSDDRRRLSPYQPQHADPSFHEIGFRWSLRIVSGIVVQKTRHGREIMRTLWSGVPPVLQLPTVFRAATGRQMRRSPDGGITIKSAVAVFGRRPRTILHCSSVVAARSARVFWPSCSGIECGLLSGLKGAACLAPRAGMVICGSGPNLVPELWAPRAVLVCLTPICSIICPFGSSPSHTHSRVSVGRQRPPLAQAEKLPAGTL